MKNFYRTYKKNEFYRVTLIVSLPLLYSAEILPPVFSVSDFAIDRPSPVEFLPFSTVKYLSKSLPTSISETAEAEFSKRTSPFSFRVTEQRQGTVLCSDNLFM